MGQIIKYFCIGLITTIFGIIAFGLLFVGVLSFKMVGMDVGLGLIPVICICMVGIVFSILSILMTIFIGFFVRNAF